MFPDPTHFLFSKYPHAMVTGTPFLPSAGARSNASTPGENLPLQPALTLLIAVLVPCVVVLALLNCALLLQRLPECFRARKRGAGGSPWSVDIEHGDESTSVESSSRGSQELGAASGSAASQGLDVARALGDGPTPGDRDLGSFRPAITVTVTQASGSLRGQPLRGLNQRRMSQRTVSSSDLEGRASQVPPNTPVSTPGPRATPAVQYAQKTSTQRKRQGNTILIVSPMDSVHFEQPSTIRHDHTAIPFSANSSSAGPGLDSDFGASAGVSLRILSSDSESCSYSWVSGLEWDYYDPGYKRRNQRRIQRHQFPILCSKQYWV
ncbi:protein huluwa-like [Lissotriton helveticus]